MYSSMYGRGCDRDDLPEISMATTLVSVSDLHGSIMIGTKIVYLVVAETRAAKT